MFLSFAIVVYVRRCCVLCCLLRLPPNLPVRDDCDRGSTVRAGRAERPGSWSWSWSVSAAQGRRTATHKPVILGRGSLHTKEKRARLTCCAAAESRPVSGWTSETTLLCCFAVAPLRPPPGPAAFRSAPDRWSPEGVGSRFSIRLSVFFHSA